jgi:hypothetical protein
MAVAVCDADAVRRLEVVDGEMTLLRGVLGWMAGLFLRVVVVIVVAVVVVVVVAPRTVFSLALSPRGHLLALLELLLPAPLHPVLLWPPARPLSILLPHLRPPDLFFFQLLLLLLLLSLLGCLPVSLPSKVVLGGGVRLSKGGSGRGTRERVRAVPLMVGVLPEHGL